MTDWKCPDCGGEFPDTAAMSDDFESLYDRLVCPWCSREGAVLTPGAPPDFPEGVTQ